MHIDVAEENTNKNMLLSQRITINRYCFLSESLKNISV